MAKFIELPFGNYNKDVQAFERTMMLVNLDRIIKITPRGETACTVTIAGGSQVLTFRRYDTLAAQITNRTDMTACYPDEEVAAAFAAGYEKAKLEMNPSESRKKQIKRLSNVAAEWFEKNPLSLGWQSRFRRDVRAVLEGTPDTPVEEEGSEVDKIENELFDD